jgi:trigger factor
MEIKQKKLPKSQIELEFELTAEEFKEHMTHAVEHLKGHIKIDGFRPGQAPAKMVEDKIKPEALLMEAGDHAVQHVYSDYIRENKIEAVGHPEIQIKKIAKGSEFIFTATITVLPEIELPDYKTIAKAIKSNDISVTEEEIQDSLNYLQKSRAKMSLKNDVAQKGDFVEIEYSCDLVNDGKFTKDQFVLGDGGMIKGFEENITNMKAGEEKTFTLKFPEKSPFAGKDGEFKVKIISVHKMELPEINDEFAKQLGAFETLATLKDNMKQGLTQEKQEQEKQRVRAEILEKIAEKAKFEIPESMVEYEQQRLFEDLKNRIAQVAKIPFEQYLASVKKTEQEIKDSYKKEAEKRLKGFLVLRQLGKTENVQISDKEIEEETSKSIKNYSPEQLKQIDINELKEYTKGVIQNEKIFQILEKLSQN